MRARPGRRLLPARTGGGLPGRLAALICAAAMAVGLLLAIGHFGAGLDEGLRAWRDRLHPRAASGRNVLVEIDERSIVALHRWPWPRSLHGRAVTALRALGARTIAFDVDFSSPSDAGEDAAFAAAIARPGAPVVLPTLRQQVSQSAGTLVESLPIPVLRAHALLASVNISGGANGFVTSYPYGVTIARAPRPSVGALLAGAGGRSGVEFPIDGAIEPASIPHISFVDLLRGRVPRDRIAGRNVLIGATAIELGDRYPMARFGFLPGATIQLLASESLIGGSSPTNRGSLPPLLLLAPALLLAARGRGWRRNLGFGLAGAGLFLAPLALEVAKLGTVEVAPALAALLVAVTCSAIASALLAIREARLVDADTQLPNDRALASALRRDQPGRTLVAVKIDGFGEVVAVLGHEAAAGLVRRVAQRLQLAAAGAIYRIEPGVLAWTGTIAGDADTIEAAAAMLAKPVQLEDRRLELTVGFGVAPAERGGRAAIGNATMAARGALARNLRWLRYDEAQLEASDWRLRLAEELDQAMATGAIWVAYQPKLDLRTRSVRAAEALVRWRHPNRGDLPPDAFIPALEELGRIADLTLHVMTRALRDQHALDRAGHPIDVAVNLSANLLDDAAFLSALEQLIAEERATPSRLTLEVTETMALLDSDRALAALNRLHGLGVHISIDDYGTGQSTLSYLKRLPAREVKVDKSFVLELDRSRSDQAMVRSTVALAHELGFEVVAEGIENEASLELLASYGCDMAQGFHISRPVPLPQLVAFLGRDRSVAA